MSGEQVRRQREINDALLTCAKLMAADDAAWMTPIFERLEAERDRLARQAAALTRAKELAAAGQ